MKSNEIGTCHLCGTNGPLTFEHAPPRAAFNDRPVILPEFIKMLNTGPDEELTGRTQQRGAGAYTLCSRCNNNTGTWYGKRYVDWCCQGMELLKKSNGNPSLVYLNYIFPLAIIKQIITMFFSLNGPGFQGRNSELVRFVLNKNAKYLSPKYRIFVYYNLEGRYRYIPICAGIGGATHTVRIMAEIAFPPFGYVMTFDSTPPDDRLVEITYFSEFDYDHFRVSPLRLPVLPTHILCPGDYRSKEEICQKSSIAHPTAD